MEASIQLHTLAALSRWKEEPERSWVGPTAGLEFSRKEKISCPYQNQALGHPVHSLVTI
jgi:hypothetical protein